jgi:hypothetical protein
MPSPMSPPYDTTKWRKARLSHGPRRLPMTKGAREAPSRFEVAPATCGGDSPYVMYATARD